MQPDSIRAIVTGGVSGLGLAVATRVVADGGRVALFDVNDDKGAEAIIARRDAAEDSHLDALLELRDAFFPQANLCCEGHMGWRRRRCPCGRWRPA